MDNETALNTLSPLLASAQAQVAALQVAMDILTNGYKSDQITIQDLQSTISALQQNAIQESTNQVTQDVSS